MKILFVQPHTSETLISGWGRFSRKLNFFPHLSIQQLAALTPKEHKIMIIDQRSKKVDYNLNCDLVMMYFKTEDAVKAYQIADKFREKGKKVVLGGWHPSALPEESLKHANSVLIGETEITWQQLLNDYTNKSSQPFYKQSKPVDPNLIPIAKRNIGDNFFPIARIQATRGCPIGCNFCRIPPMEGKELRKRPIENVIKELKNIRQKFIYFQDASLTLDPEYSKTLFSEMKGLRKHFCCNGNPDVLGNNDEFLELAKSAGCAAWYVGFESISNKVITDLNKTTNKVDDYPDIVKKIHDYKMAVFGSFIFGFDTDTNNTFKDTSIKAFEWGIDIFESNTLTPYPGTPLFERMIKEERITSKNWQNYNEIDVVFKMKNIDEKKYIEDGWKATIEYNWAFRKELGRLKKVLKLGIYPFITTYFQSHFW